MNTLLVVLYNKHISESETLTSLSQWNDFQKNLLGEIIVWNNSSFDLSPEECNDFTRNFANTKVVFKGDRNNHPLSEVYNTVIRETNENGYLIIFDHDSTVSGEYIEEIGTIANSTTKYNLVLPRIYFNEQLVSPARLYYFLGRFISIINPGPHASKFMTAINSGMCIDKKYLKNTFVGYNEKIKFYGTDNDFMWKYSKDNEQFYVMNQKIKHILNCFEEQNFEKKKLRLKDVKNGMMEQMKNISPFILALAKIYWFLFYTKFLIQFKFLKK